MAEAKASLGYFFGMEVSPFAVKVQPSQQNSSTFQQYPIVAADHTGLTPFTFVISSRRSH
jgi:hypothetical protein